MAFTEAPLQPVTLADNPAGFSEVDITGDADGFAASLGNALVTYDFEPATVVNGNGADLRLHALDSGGAPFADVDVLVSEDGVSFISIKASEVAGTPDAEGLVSATYDAASSGLAAIRFVRIQGTSTSLPGEGGFRLDSLEAINAVPSGVLLADTVSVTEHNASLLIAEPFGDNAHLFYGKTLGTAGNAPGNGQTTGGDVVAYQYDAATPLSSESNAEVADNGLLNNTLNPSELAAFEGALINDGLATVIDMGDVNGDGADDLLLASNTTAYLFLGAIDPSGVENIAEAADLIIDLTSLGAVAQTAGDFNGDGKNDLAFVTALGDNSVVTVLTNLDNAPRVLDATSIAELRADTVFTIQLDSTAVGSGEVSLHALNWDGDGKSDLLVVANAPLGGTLGHIFAGEDITDANRTTGTPLAQASAISRLTSSVDLAERSAFASDLLDGFTPAASDITTVHDISARVVGDVNGDGRDDIVITDAGYVRFQNNLAGLPDGGRVYLVTGPGNATAELGFPEGQLSSPTFVNNFDILVATQTPSGGGGNPYRLSSDATFEIVPSNGDAPISVTLLRESTQTNNSISDLNADLDAALGTANPAFNSYTPGVNGEQRLAIWRSDAPGDYAIRLIRGNGDVELNTQSARIWQDYELGGDISVVGDINNDGFDEIAFSRKVEGGEWAEGSLFIVNGGIDLDQPAPIVSPLADADFIFKRPDTAGLSVGTGYATAPTATAGDFDGDGQTDLAVGVTANILQTPFSTIDSNERGEVFVFWNIGAREGTINLSGSEAAGNGDTHIVGENAGDKFGTMSLSPRR